MATSQSRAEARVFGLLDRSQGFANPLFAVAASLRGDRQVDTDLSFEDLAVIGFDTNALFKMAGSAKSSLITDRLGAATVRMVLPGQVVQEFWNNKLEGLPRLSKDVSSSLQSLQEHLGQLQDDYGLELVFQDLRAKADIFASAHQGLVSTNLTTSLRSLFEMLSDKAHVSYVSRTRFAPLGEVRRLTKTPPGFKDPATTLGDFFVWADFLMSLSILGAPFRSGYVVFVTEDRKKDWEIRGHVHPILAAEVESLTSREFVLWSVADLINFLDR